MIDKKKINDILSSSGADDGTKRQITDFISKMSDKDIQKLNSILNNEQATQQILNSPKAQELINKFKNGSKT
ncbi:MAG: hypothetical protein ACI4IV_01880 [Acutalibacteraceae bacterium]